MSVKISASFRYQETDPKKREEALNRVCTICGRALKEHSPEEYVTCREKELKNKAPELERA